MEEMLQSALRGSPSDVQSQIEYILSQLCSEGGGDEGVDSGDEEEPSEGEEDEEVSTSPQQQ